MDPTFKLEPSFVPRLALMFQHLSELDILLDIRKKLFFRDGGNVDSYRGTTEGERVVYEPLMTFS